MRKSYYKTIETRIQKACGEAAFAPRVETDRLLKSIADSLITLTMILLDNKRHKEGLVDDENVT